MAKTLTFGSVALKGDAFRLCPRLPSTSIWLACVLHWGYSVESVTWSLPSESFQFSKRPSGRQREGCARERWPGDRVWRLKGPQQGVFNIALQVREDSMDEVILEFGFGARLRSIRREGGERTRAKAWKHRKTLYV